MPRAFEVYLQDILEAIGKIRTYTADMGREEFGGDSKTIDAVLRNLEVIGEAAKSIPESARQQYQNVEWRKMAGLRDILIHHYFGVNLDIVWDILQNEITGLAEGVREILNELGAG